MANPKACNTESKQLRCLHAALPRALGLAVRGAITARDSTREPPVVTRAYTRRVSGPTSEKALSSASSECRAGSTVIPFPSAAPASLADIDSIRANDWSAYTGLDCLENHWSLKAWPPEYAAYYWYLTFDSDALRALAEQCQQRLDSTYLDPVPPEWLHMTLLKVGSDKAVDVGELPSFVSAARTRLTDFDAFSLQVGPLSGSRSALRFSVTPWDQLSALHSLLRQSVIDVNSTASPKQTEHFRPHLGIAYNNHRRWSDTVVAEVEALREIEPVGVEVSQVKLVRLKRVDHQYRWDECGIVALRT